MNLRKQVFAFRNVKLRGLCISQFQIRTQSFSVRKSKRHGNCSLSEYENALDHFSRVSRRQLTPHGFQEDKRIMYE